MPEDTKTTRSNCRFLVQQTPDGKAVVMVQLLHETVPALNKAVVGFDLLGGTRLEQAKAACGFAQRIRARRFVTVTEKGATA